MILGLDRLPAEDANAEDDASADAAAPATADAGYCARAEAGTLFCEDFDDDGPPFARWKGFLGAFPPSRAEDASAERTTDLSHTTPASLRVQARRSGASAYAYLVTELDDVRGARAIAMTARAKILAWTDDRDAAFLDPSHPNPRANIFGIAAAKGPLAVGAQLMFSSQLLGVYAGSLADTAVTDVATAPFDYEGASRIAWISVHLAIGQPQAARAHAATAGREPTCPDAPAVAIVWASVPLRDALCIPVDAVFADLSTQALAVNLGLGLGDDATASVALDTFHVWGLP